MVIEKYPKIGLPSIDSTKTNVLVVLTLVLVHVAFPLSVSKGVYLLVVLPTDTFTLEEVPLSNIIVKL